MRDCSVLKCKLALDLYVWHKANSLIPREANAIASTMDYLLRQVQSHTTAMESLLHQERAGRAGVLDAEKEKIIAGLRR